MMALARHRVIEILFIILIGLTPLIWFEPGMLITSVDVDWPLDPLKRIAERSYVWYPQFQSGTDRSINTASLPFFSIPGIFQFLGFDLITGEKLTYVFWYTMSGFAIYFLILQIIPGGESWKRMARLVVVAAYLYNFYVFFLWPRLQLGISAYVLLPIILGVLIKGLEKQESYLRSGAAFAVPAVICASIGIQPPLIGSILIAVTVYVIFYSIIQIRSQQKYLVMRSIYLYVVLILVFLLSNMFWVYPLANFIVESDYTTSATGIDVYRVVDLLRWVSQYTSVLNVITNMADVIFYDSWGGEEYYPVLSSYRNNPLLIIAKMVIPITAFSLILFYRNRYVLYFAILSVIGIFLSKGSHPPLGAVFMWMVENIPGFWIYRAPWQKFGILITLGYSVLMGIACGRIYRYLEHLRWKKIPLIGPVGLHKIFALFIGLFLAGYHYPIIMGKMFSSATDSNAGFHYKYHLGYHLEYPDYILSAGKWINNQAEEFNLFLLPDDKTNVYSWRYGASGDISLQLFDRGLFFRQYGEGMAPPHTVEGLYRDGIEMLYDNSNKHSGLFVKLLKYLNVKYLLQRNDFVFDFYGDTDSPAFIRSKLSQQEGIHLEKSFGKWEFYRVDDPFPHIYASPFLIPVSSDTSSLVPLIYTDSADEYPVVAFTGQQDEEILGPMIASQNTSISEEIIFANTRFNDLVLDLARAEALNRNGRGRTSNPSAALVRLNAGREGHFDLDKKGMYEIWIKTTGADFEEIQAVQVSDYRYPIERTGEQWDEWIRIGIGDFKDARNRIMILKDKKESDGENMFQDPPGIVAEIIILSPRKRLELEQILKKKQFVYLFNKKDRVGTNKQPENYKREFYIPANGNYNVASFLKARKEEESAFYLNEKFEEGTTTHWNLMLRENADTKSHPSPATSLQIEAPWVVYLFGDNFYNPENHSYPLQGKAWRWMSNNGKLMIINPFKSSIVANITFSASSFRMGRKLDIVINGKGQESVILPGPRIDIPEKVIKKILDRKDLGIGSGHPLEIEIKDINLQPGLNEMSFSASPSATIVSDPRMGAVSISVSDDLRVSISKVERKSMEWKNRDGFSARIGEQSLILEDTYRMKGEEISWISKPLESVKLIEYPLFKIEYAWHNPEIQSMDVGFRIDRDGDGEQDTYLIRSLPAPALGWNRFELDLLDIVWDSFPEALNPYLVEFDLFPHKKWGLDTSGLRHENRQLYMVKGIKIASKEGSVIVNDKGSFSQVKMAGKGYHSVSQDGDTLMVAIPVGGAKQESAVMEATIPLSPRLVKNQSALVLPYRLEDHSIQDLKVFVLYDLNNDGTPDKSVLAGRKIPISAWKRLTRDRKEPMFLYEAMLPPYFPSEYDTAGKRYRNFMISKNERSLSPTWEEDFSISKEQVQVEGRRVIINLPSGMEPDDFRYEAYYIPREWIKESRWFLDFNEVVLDMADLEEHLFKDEVIPVGLKIVFEGRITDSRENQELYEFTVKSPRYVTWMLPELKEIPVEQNLPIFQLNGKALKFDRQIQDKDKGGLWLTQEVFLEEGDYDLRIFEEGGLEAYLVKISPLGGNHKEALSSLIATPLIQFTKINPTRYVLNVEKATEPFVLVFNEGYHPGWKGYVRKNLAVGAGRFGEPMGRAPWSALWSAWEDRGKRIEMKDHFVANGYANGWMVNPSSFGGQQSFEMLLEYKPQRLFEIGLIISILTILICGVYMVLGKRRSIRKHDKPD